MDLSILITLVIVGILVISAIVVFVLFFPESGQGKILVANPASSKLRSMIDAQREQNSAYDRRNNYSPSKNSKLALSAASESGLTRQRTSASKLSLQKRLVLAKWKMTPIQFRFLQAGVTLLLFIPSLFIFYITLILTILFLTPMLIRDLMDRRIKKNFLKFDEDYPTMLLSYVSLLKTGMSTLTGLEATGKGLDEDSLVRLEIELLMERLRLGLTEEQAINAFGEGISHPELELFVQSILLSRRIGGNLSATLDRLARQVRKRQEFRKRAMGAIAMEKGSMYVIFAILFSLICFIAYMNPVLILPAFTHPFGTKIVQTGVASIIWGIYLGRKVANIKV